jgi:outer membrane protein OmpA-like peptidoglycan-associated protein
MKPTIFAAVMAASALGLGGCATKDYVNEQVAAEDTKVQATQGQVSQHETRLGQLDQATKDALDRATAAGKLAERLTDFAEKLKNDNRNVYVEIQGHTDSKGADAVNIRLGEERAEAVRLFMNQHGVPLNRMATISYGKQDPAGNNKTRTGRAQNRRVVLVVMS